MSTKYTLIQETEDIQVVSQMQNGDVILSESGDAAIFIAGAAENVMGKSALSTRIDPVSLDDPKTVSLEYDFMVPEGYPLDSIIIADFESSSSEFGSNPGIRVYMRDGYLRVDRSKIGEEETWYADQEFPIEHGSWNQIEINMVPGVDGSGVFEIYLNGTLILSETGTNVISPSTLAEYGLSDADVSLDRVQLGVTSNSNDTEAVLAIRNVELAVEDEIVMDCLTPVVSVAAAVYQEGTETKPVIVEDNPDNSFFGLDLKGTSGADTLVGEQWDDTISGGGGNDVLYGGTGSDILIGGTGSDVFIFQSDMGLDIIKDFKAGQDDIRFQLEEAFDAGKFDAIKHKEGTVIKYGDSAYLLEGVARSELSIDDFII